MRRREFIAILAGALSWSRLAAAQQLQPMRRVAVLMPVAPDAVGRSYLAAFREELRKSGWVENRTVQIVERWGSGDIEHIRADASALIESRPDAILCYSVRALTALKERTQTIPVVFIATSDPVQQGFVASMSRPGGNLTGFTVFEFSILGKMLQVLKEIAPQSERVGVIYNPENVSAGGYFRTLEAVAPSLGVKIVPAVVRNASDITAAILPLAGGSSGALLVPPDITATVHQKLIISLSSEHKIPAVYFDRGFVLAGGLIAYGPDTVDLFRRAADYVARIMNGDDPAELPVQAPTKLELVINNRSAKALGLPLPATLLARADEVIE